MENLFHLQADIGARVEAILVGQPQWPCRLGCDGCCRSLADIPTLSSPEWALLRDALAALPVAAFAEVSKAILALSADSTRPIICPLLNRSSGACWVYAQRPLACRSYGFYLERGVGLYCKEIEQRAAAGECDEVTWGNHEALIHRAKGLGMSSTLTEWFKVWEFEGFPGLPADSVRALRA